MSFLLVYIQEAHPTDGWALPVNADEGVCYTNPTSFEERLALARTCRDELKLSIPCAVDDIHNPVDEKYSGFPERMFVVDRDGTVAYVGRPGPWGFKPQEVEVAIQGLVTEAASRP